MVTLLSNPKLGLMWGPKCLWFIRTVKPWMSVHQEQTLHCPIQSPTWFSINKSGDPWNEEPDCLLNIRSGKNCMNRISRCIVALNIAAHSQPYNHVKEESFNSCGLHSPWQQRRKESDGRRESIMWQWCHGSTGSDQGHMSYGVPLLSSVPCIPHMRNWIFRLRVDWKHRWRVPYCVQTMSQTADISVKTSFIRNKLSSDSLQNTTSTQDYDKLPSGRVILLSCCDR